MGRIIQRYTKYKYRKSKVAKANKNKRGNHKRCSKCGRFM